IVHETGTIRIPFFETEKPVSIFAQGATPGSQGGEVAFQREGNELILNVTPEIAGRILWVVPDSNAQGLSRH
ncbi:MAG: hypothetical protein FWH27_18195, partial [Planctomycetaceae bacterium]|nr:hypothetical protein [Planctomycetaceae bacterium]